VIFRLRAGAAARSLALASLVSAACLVALADTARGEAVPTGGRAWELISAADPVSAQISEAGTPGQEDARIVYTSLGPMPGALSGALLSNANIAERTDAGWRSKPLGFPYSFEEQSLTVLMPYAAFGFSADRRTSLWLSVVPLTPDGPPKNQMALYLRTPDGVTSLVSGVEGESPLGMTPLAELSRDGHQVVFASSEHLLPADASRTSGVSLYRWTAAAGLRLVDVADDGTLLSSCGSIASVGGISSTGDRVFFVSPGEPGCPGTQRVYLREADSSTVEVSASHCTRLDCNAPADVAFAGATPSGERVFMTTVQQLTDDDVDTVRDLYRYDVDSGHLELLTDPQPEADGEVQLEMVHASEDGARVYFNASGRLVTGEGDVSGGSLYLADQEGLHFLSPAPSGEIQASADGRRLLLSTSLALDEDDTDGITDVYLYDTAKHDFTRLSSGPSGGNGPKGARLKMEPSGFIVISPTREPTNAITADGRRAFFITAEPLVPADANDAMDAYEWADGHLGLLSSGRGRFEAVFRGVSADGRTALIMTDASLTPDDRDGGEGDVYAARIGGGFSEGGSPGCSCPGGETTNGGLADRPTPASAVLRAARPRGRLKLLDSGWRFKGDGDIRLSLSLRVPAPGFVSARLRSPGAGPDRAVLARGGGGAVRPGKMTIGLRLTADGHRRLTRLHKLGGSLIIRQDDQRVTRPSPPYPGPGR
jgi:hypothetical protein